MKLEKISNISSERTLQYEIYEPYNKTKLNLSICNNVSVEVYIPVKLSEKLQNLYDDLKDMGYDLFDANSPFYQDICTPYTSNDGTDVPLTDRTNYYLNNEETVCQPNCKFSDYLMDSQYLKCDCDVMNSDINMQESVKFNAKAIYQSFYSVLKYSNYKVLKCYKLALSINSFTINLGSIISIAYFFLFCIFFIIYISKGKNQFKANISNAFKINIQNKNSNNTKINQSENKKKLIINKKGIIKDNLKSKIKIKDNTIKNKIKTKSQFQKYSVKSPPKKVIHNKKAKLNNNKNKINNINIKLDNNIILFRNKKGIKNYNGELYKIIRKKDINNNEKKFQTNQTNNKNMELLDYYELNNLDYIQAKKLDKRNCFQMYWSLLKREHSFIFTFITKDDYNITMIKCSRFIFLLCTDMAMNVFFFSDETMHKMFLDYGKYNFIQQIPQIIYSTIVSKLIEILLCFLSMTDKYYYQIKDNKNININLYSRIIKCVKIKIVFFYIFTILMFAFYWYLITCFCAVYKNTQIAFIKDSLSSFLFGNLIPFVIYIFPSLFRIISLKIDNAFCSKCIYQFSNMIPCF